MPAPTNRDACLRCGGDLTDGYLVERTRNSHGAVRWVSGVPDRGLFGLRLRDKQVLDVEARRCRACGWLDLHAPKYD